jgi:hydrogenase maturation protease
MDPRPWPELGARLSLLRGRSAKILIVGVGNLLRGDDGVGHWIVKTLRRNFRLPSTVGALAVGDSPESFSEDVHRATPSFLLFIDAADLGAAPGEIHVLPLEDTGLGFPSTHGLPLKLVLRAYDVRAEGYLLAIQPAQLKVDAPLSPAVRTAGERVVSWLAATLGLEEKRHG